MLRGGCYRVPFALIHMQPFKDFFLPLVSMRMIKSGFDIVIARV